MRVAVESQVMGTSLFLPETPDFLVEGADGAVVRAFDLDASNATDSAGRSTRAWVRW